MSDRLRRFAEKTSKPIGANGANGTPIGTDAVTNAGMHRERYKQPIVELSLYTEFVPPIPLAPLAPLAEDPPKGAGDQPRVDRPDWTDDRLWIGSIVRARDETAKLAVLAEWVAAYGGETMGRTVMLPALPHHTKRRLAELELRRMCEQARLEVLEDEK
jgi:hypothetical protein